MARHRTTRAGSAVRQCYPVCSETRERLRLAKAIVEQERGRRVTYNELFEEIASAAIHAAMQRARRAGKHPPDVLAQAKAMLAMTAKAAATTHGPTPPSGTVYEH